MTDQDVPQGPTASDDRPDPAREPPSKALLVATVLFALAALILVAFLINSRRGDSEPDPPQGPASVDLSAPLYPDGSTQNLIHLVAAPLHEGANSIEVRFTAGGDLQNPLDMPLDGVELALAPLDNADEGRSMALVAADVGVYRTAEPVELHNGWWEVTATIYPTGEAPRSTIFYLLLPDPNINHNEGETDTGDPAAQRFFEAGLAQLGATHSIKFIERLTSGEGAASIMQREVTAGVGGQPAASRSVNADFELLTIGDRTFQRKSGGNWFEREFLPVNPISNWVSLYEGATDFARAESVMINDRTTQIITFFVPENDASPAAWYAWWVDAETGYVIREAMISYWHYMIYEFGEFNQPLSFDVPIAAATPVASPGS